MKPLPILFRLRADFYRRSCVGKRQHKSQEAAASHAASIGREGMVYREYLCSFCGRWHVGRRPLREVTSC